MSLVEVFTVLAALLVLSYLYYKVADKLNIIDKPNKRSSHDYITIRGGGVLVIFSTIIWFVLAEDKPYIFMTSFIVLAVISFLDDLLSLPSVLRLVIHIASVSAILFTFSTGVPYLLLLVFMTIATLAWVNAFNFMDGINGITGMYGLVVLGSLYIYNLEVRFTDESLLVYSILAILVFGIYNFRKRALMFAGDVGAVSIAVLIAFVFISLLVHSGGSLVFILFLGLYGVDAFFTIMMRLKRRENILKPHRSHLFQLLANEGKVPHLAVSLSYALIQLAINLVVIFVLPKQGMYAIMSLMGGLAVLSVVYFYLRNQYIVQHLANR